MSSTKGSKGITNLISLHLLIVFYSIISILAKKAAQFDLLSRPFMTFYSLEILCIAIYAYFWQKILKKFDLTVAYANKAAVLIYNLIWGYLLFRERITFNNMLGIVIIICGVWVGTKDGL